ncbi:unnamed protein product [Parascedosporium putredinis]|uniref:Uncharacterized protein n=1 Tax=Parascedosporium putredinis TaxID=1442378 RepID=A0A9P1GX01_9PEZI|nr:unnamed protein product [Parascedosporium putredinis]CAI7989361.1 unnamed protein product [Parascedosporium putredinis]
MRKQKLSIPLIAVLKTTKSRSQAATATGLSPPPRLARQAAFDFKFLSDPDPSVVDGYGGRQEADLLGTSRISGDDEDKDGIGSGGCDPVQTPNTKLELRQALEMPEACQIGSFRSSGDYPRFLS